MDVFAVVLFTGILLFAVFLATERNKQRAKPFKRKELFMPEPIEEEINDIAEDFYGDKSSHLEFLLGIALISVLDTLDNPDEYDDDSYKNVYADADEWAAMFRLKYSKEIVDRGVPS
jgi:hypothetical protein